MEQEAVKEACWTTLQSEKLPKPLQRQQTHRLLHDPAFGLHNIVPWLQQDAVVVDKEEQNKDCFAAAVAIAIDCFRELEACLRYLRIPQKHRRLVPVVEGLHYPKVGLPLLLIIIDFFLWHSY